MNYDESDTTSRSIHPSGPNNPSQQLPFEHLIISDKSKENVRLSTAGEKKPKSALSKKTLSYVYSNKYPRRGMCLIISVDKFDEALDLPTRPGADVDITKIVDCFASLEYETFLLKNPSAKSMISAVNKMSHKEHEDAESFVCFILTHGDEGGMIYARDTALYLDQIVQPFRGANCSQLLGKPKVFFIQACRGTKLDEGTAFSETDSSPQGGPTMSAFRKIPCEADLLMAYAVQPGYYAFRNSVSGSWFVQALTQCLAAYGRSLDLMSILTRVNNRVAFEFESSAATPEYSGKKQMPSVVSTLTKDYFFAPKQRIPTQTNITGSQQNSR